jgi:Family of unknown function (DUF5317)
VIVSVLAAIGVVSALWSIERAKRLAALPLRRVWLVWTAFLTQVVVLQFVAASLPTMLSETIHLATYAVLVLFVLANRRLPGALVIAAGTACNLIAIAANGGTMPADMGAWERAGLAPISPGEFANSAALSDPKLAFLGDVFAIPAGWPLANVFSIGDVLIVVGGTYLAHRWCARPQSVEVPDEEPALSHA